MSVYCFMFGLVCQCLGCECLRELEDVWMYWLLLWTCDVETLM